MLQPEVTILHLGGALVPAEELRDTLLLLLCTFLEEELELYSILLHCFFFFFSTALSLFLPSLPSLISNCLDLPFGRRRSRRPKPISYKQETGDTRAFASRSVPLIFPAIVLCL